MTRKNPEAPDATVKFLLYNIRYGTGTGVGYHMPLPFTGYFLPSGRNTERILNFIKREKPDIIGLIEVDEGSYRSRKVNQAQWIAQELGYAHVYASKYGEDSLVRRMPVLKSQGNAFITNQAIMARQFHFFKAGIKKLVIELEFDTFVIFLVHLSLKFRHRQHQLSDLLHLFKSVNKPLIVAGDFNVFWGDYELELFLEATNLQNANVNGLPTFPSITPRRQLDFILHSPEIQVRSFSVCPIKYSDHMPVLCRFDVPPRVGVRG
ncbi:MAG TPA: endonuclease/exonuclease/phosphatase family protein [Candidatus Hydrogenedentes bacterium]|nr:endonuclease/exonuclease/phosphatase family protein [Candidatus Hydrogenedentota bacterium]